MNPSASQTPRWEIKISDEDGITPYLWDDRKSDNYDLGTLCRILNEYEEKTNEVARLREICEWAADMMDGISPARGQEIRDAIARLAPAPEEPVIQDSRITEPEWRELGPDEVICEGDEVKEKDASWLRDEWKPVYPCTYGFGKTNPSPYLKFRTRRPLPTTNHKQISSKLVVEPKHEEMPLEDEIERSLKLLNEDPYLLDTDEKFGEVVLCLRYLRDEILKLKEAK